MAPSLLAIIRLVAPSGYAVECSLDANKSLKSVAEEILGIPPENVHFFGDDGGEVTVAVDGDDVRVVTGNFPDRTLPMQHVINATEHPEAFVTHGVHFVAGALDDERLQLFDLFEYENSLDTLRLVLPRMAQVTIDARDSDGCTILHYAPNADATREILRWMSPDAIDAVSTVHEEDRMRDMMLAIRVRFGCMTLREAMNTCSMSGQTALHRANDAAQTHALLEKMSQNAIDTLDASGRTALLFAQDLRQAIALIEKMSPGALSNSYCYESTATALSDEDRDDINWMITERCAAAWLR